MITIIITIMIAISLFLFSFKALEEKKVNVPLILIILLVIAIVIGINIYVNKINIKYYATLEKLNTIKEDTKKGRYNYDYGFLPYNEKANDYNKDVRFLNNEFKSFIFAGFLFPNGIAKLQKLDLKEGYFDYKLKQE